jgi:threonine synthase
VAGAKALRAAGTIADGESVVAILTGHLLKDPGMITEMHGDGDWLDRPNRPIPVEATIAAIRRAIEAG